MAPSAHPGVDASLKECAARIREHRKERGWTLRDLASRLSVSAATMSAIENGQISPNIALLLRLGQAFGIRPERLISDAEASRYQITRRSQIDRQEPAPIRLVGRTHRSVINYHNRLWLLADGFPGRRLEPFEIEIQPIPDREIRFISHHHEEFVFVLRGEIEILIKSPDGLLRETLAAGDCLYFWSFLPHCIRSTSRARARGVHVQYSIHEPPDSDRSVGGGGPVIYLSESPHRSVVDQVAERIVSLRHVRGLPVAEFARHLGISARRLTSIERGVRAPSLNLLLRISEKFQKPMTYFLAGAFVDQPYCKLTRAADIRNEARPPGRAAPGCFAQGLLTPLARGFEGRGMDPFLVRLRSRTERPLRVRPHRGQEFIYVLNGSVKLLTCDSRDGTREEILSVGDSCFLDASLPHKFVEWAINPYGPTQADLMAVFWPGWRRP